MRHVAEVEPVPLVNAIESVLVAFQVAVMVLAAIAGVVTA